MRRHRRRPAGQRARSNGRSQEIGRRGEEELWALGAVGEVTRREWKRFLKAFVFAAAQVAGHCDAQDASASEESAKVPRLALGPAAGARPGIDTRLAIDGRR